MQKFEKKNNQRQKLTKCISVFPYNPATLQKGRVQSIPSGYFPQSGTMGLIRSTNTIASRVQFKPIGIGENLVVA